eukprot:1159842-Pelagomonas_calceolata.AAC.4
MGVRLTRSAVTAAFEHTVEHTHIGCSASNQHVQLQCLRSAHSTAVPQISTCNCLKSAHSTAAPQPCWLTCMHVDSSHDNSASFAACSISARCASRCSAAVGRPTRPQPPASPSAPPPPARIVSEPTPSSEP